MSFGDRLFSYFPLLMTVTALVVLTGFAHWNATFAAVMLLTVIYIVPPVVLRIVKRWAPLRPGVVKIDEKTFCGWHASHHIQAFYDALPFLESLLRVIPGFYSMWLRLWGSRVGYGVVWAVNVQILDRDLMDIGNRVIFSRQVELYGHVRRKTEAGVSRVLVRPVRIGSYAFLGANVRVGPGASVPANAAVPALTVIDANETYGEAPRHPAPEEADFALV